MANLILGPRILALQTWLGLKGYPVARDGQPGPETRNAVIEVFRNTAAPGVSDVQLRGIAQRLGCTPQQLATVARVESAGGGWDDSGLLKCLWERHYLWRRVKLAVPLLSNPTPGGYTIDADGDGINDSWEKLADASMRFGFGIAAECASFGKFQIMGAWWKALGYDSVADFVWQLSRSEAAHYEALARYVEVNKLRGALQRISANPMDCLAFAEGYNGKGQCGYDGRLAGAFQFLRNAFRGAA